MQNQKRSYNKKSSYWKKFDESSGSLVATASQNSEPYEPALCGEPFYTSEASIQVSHAQEGYSRITTNSRSGSRKNRAAFARTPDRFSSIRNGLLPYSYAMDGVNVREAIELCQKAYANVAVFRNSIDVMSEFANSEIYLEGGSQKSRDFFNQWFKKIKLWNLRDQYFREYYRSGNIFLYRVDGEFQAGDYAKLIQQVAETNAITNKVPVRYIMLNPFDIVAKRGSSFETGAYEKILSEYELARLQNPVSEEDKEVLQGLPESVRKEIDRGAYYQNGLKIELDPQKIIFSFYKKQDYEPFAIPFGYPVLEDINAKMELKKMDQAITRTVENVILLITMGAEPEKGGINQNNLIAMQKLFQNESVGRVLVSDYTTKADFVIPDLNKVLGPEKYKVLNEDIKQGLQNIVIGEEKYSATEVKAQIFLDRLKEARNAFVNDFLQPEIKRIAKNLGLKKYPTVKYRYIDVRDQTQLMRVTTRLMELGIITPQQGMEMFHTGEFPKAEDLSPSQDQFVSERKEGYYNPIVGGVPSTTPPQPKEPAQNEVTTTPRTPGRPEGTTGIPLSEAGVSLKNIQQIVKKVETTRASLEKNLKQELNLKKINPAQRTMLDKLCEAVVVSQDLNNWEETALSCVKDFENISLLSTLPEILETASKFQLEDDYSAALLYHSQKIK
jgi:hypothetical protein